MHRIIHCNEVEVLGGGRDVHWIFCGSSSVVGFENKVSVDYSLHQY